MQEEKVNGIVIRAADFKDNDKLVRLYTAEAGKIRAVLRGVKKPKAKLKFAAQLFHFGEYLFTVSPDGFRSVINCASHESFSGVYAAGRPDVYFAASFILDLLDKATPDSEPNPELFIILLKTLREFLKSDSNCKTVCAFFVLKFLRASGYRYKFGECAACGAEFRGPRKFDAYVGGTVCPACGGPYSIAVSAAAGNVLRLLSGADFDDLCRFKFEEKETAEALKILTGAAKSAFGIELEYFG